MGERERERKGVCEDRSDGAGGVLIYLVPADGYMSGGPGWPSAAVMDER